MRLPTTAESLRSIKVRTYTLYFMLTVYSSPDDIPFKVFIEFFKREILSSSYSEVRGRGTEAQVQEATV